MKHIYPVQCCPECGSTNNYADFAQTVGIDGSPRTDLVLVCRLCCETWKPDTTKEPPHA